MRILIIHNHYQQYGGEDTVFFREVTMLRDFGHQVFLYERTNTELPPNWFGFILAFFTSLWSWKSYREVKKIIIEKKPDVVHIHNWIYLISPSVFIICKKLKIPVVTTLHNPRLMCPSATFLRDGKLCQDCKGKKIPWPAFIHKCHHNSRIKTIFITGIVFYYNLFEKWKKSVNTFIVTTNTFSDIFGSTNVLAGQHIEIKPHFVYPDPEERDNSKVNDQAIFIGRFDPEKGVLSLIEAWKNIKNCSLLLRGRGRLEVEIEQFCLNNQITNITIVKNHLKETELSEMIKNSLFLVFPSEGLYETFGLVMIEAFACGTPVITSNIGVMKELVEDHRTGLLFEPGNASDLQKKVIWAINNRKIMLEYGKKCTQSL